MEFSATMSSGFSPIPLAAVPHRFDDPGTGTVTAIRPVNPEIRDIPWVAGFSGTVDGCA
jgi:hypothetical protein